MSKRRAFHKRKKSKVAIKKKFQDAMLKLRRVSKQQQRKVVAGASDEFIKDMSTYISKLWNKPQEF